jgi:glutamate formiminotransferase/formiminotetrahydrofolate cyclodeaminase
MEETAEHARELAQRIGELGIPVYCYEAAASTEQRRNLANVRAGEYEGLKEKMALAEWRPDFGPADFNPAAGATAVGARDFLVAYNINLNTTSPRRANAIAFDVREKGRIEREGHPLTGAIVRDERGEPVWMPGTLKSVKAIGWYIEEYGIAQISMNLTNIGVTPLHVAFEEVCRKADARGVRVTGSELVGLIPLQAMLDAGTHFLRKQHRSLGIPDHEIIKIAVTSLGLDSLSPFQPEEKIIEYAIADRASRKLVDLAVTSFTERTASETATPGGGSVAATVGALGASLATMVANLSSHKRGWDERWEEFSDWAVRGKAHYVALLALVDDDTAAFDRVMAAFGLPRETPEENEARHQAIQEATKGAMDVPFRVMQEALDCMAVVRAMAELGNPNSASDAGVGALCARAAVRGAYLNVKTNASGLDDRAYVDGLLRRGSEIDTRASQLEQEILEIVETRF